MNQQLTSSQKGLLWIALLFSWLAAFFVIAPYVGTYLVDRTAKNPELGGIAFNMTTGLIMLAMAAFSWMASLITLLVNFVFNRSALKTGLGVTTTVLDAFLLAYGVFFITTVYSR